MSSKIKVHAGDFDQNTTIKYDLGALHVPRLIGGPETLGIRDVETLEMASEASVKRVGGAIGWGAAGALVLGPVGLLAGLLLGGKKNEVTFVAKFKDGRKLLGTTDSKTFTQMKAALF